MKTNRTRQRSGGFSLIEVMAALTILSVMMIMLGQLFSNSSSAYRIGTGRSDMDGAARAALDFMAREIGSLQADSVLTMSVTTTNLLGRSMDVIRFVSLSNTPEIRSGNRAYREGMELCYTPLAYTNNSNRVFLGRWGIEREDSGSYTCYTSTTWHTSAFSGQQTAWANSLAENISNFKVYVYTRAGSYAATPYTSDTARLPLWIDLYLELLSDEHATQAALLAGSDRNEFLKQKARRYTQRVFLNNRQHILTW